MLLLFVLSNLNLNEKELERERERERERVWPREKEYRWVCHRA